MQEALARCRADLHFIRKEPGVMPSKKASHRSRGNSTARSMHRAYNFDKQIRKTYDDAWNKSYTSTICSTTNSERHPTTTRRRRLVPKKALVAACSGAAAEIYEKLNMRAVEVGLDPIKAESRAHPWLPSISKGAVAMLESFLCAYAQEAVADAWAISEHAAGRKRLSQETMNLGLANVNRRIFLSEGITSRVPLNPKSSALKSAIAAKDKPRTPRTGAL
jgi:hypothetical protein